MRRIVFGVMACLLLACLTFVSSVHSQSLRNVYGMNTMVYGGSDELQKQLQWTKTFTGQNGHVKQLFYPVTAKTVGPSQQAKEYVNEAYKNGLNPVLRLQGEYDQEKGWIKPIPDGSGSYANKYTKVAAGYKKFVSGLPRVSGRTLYIEIWNEPNLHHEWSGAANVAQYSRFFVDTATAIRSIGDSRIKILNGGLSAGGDIDNLQFIQAAIKADPKFKSSFDMWASHPYSRNVPPEINHHSKTAPTNSRDTIDAYMLELQVLKNNGVDTSRLKVLATEAGYRLYDSWYAQYPAINEENRAIYMKKAFELWSQWPEVISVMPFQLSDSAGTWWDLNWVYPTSTNDRNGFPTQPYLQYASLLRGTGTIRGTVLDSNGNAIKDAVLTTDANGHQAVSLQDGSFVMIAYPGTYTVTVVKDAFPPSTVQGVSSVTGTQTRMDVIIQTVADEPVPATIQNAGFESGDLTGWTPYGAVDGVQSGTWFNTMSSHEGNYFFGTAANWGSKNGGVYQRVAVTNGKTLTLKGWVQTYVEGSAVNGNKIGIDPTGGTDPQAASVVWGSLEQSQNIWNELTLTSVAASDIVTIYLDFTQNNGNIWNVNAFDTISLTEL